MTASGSLNMSLCVQTRQKCGMLSPEHLAHCLFSYEYSLAGSHWEACLSRLASYFFVFVFQVPVWILPAVSENRKEFHLQKYDLSTSLILLHPELLFSGV